METEITSLPFVTAFFKTRQIHYMDADFDKAALQEFHFIFTSKITYSYFMFQCG